MRILHNLNVDFMGKRKLFYALSITLFLIGFLNMLIRGIQFGIDFKGGTELQFKIDKPIDVTVLRDNVLNIGLGDLEVKMFGGNQGALIRTELQEIPKDIFPKVVDLTKKVVSDGIPGLPINIAESTNNSVTFQFANPDTAKLAVNLLTAHGYQAGRVSQEPTNSRVKVQIGIADWIKENLRSKLANYNFELRKAEVIGPKVGNELKWAAFWALLLSLLGILVYLAFRYKFIFAFGAVLALFHDVLITLGLYSALNGVIPNINLEFNLTIMAAFLTLIGYSIMDTVIVFDRVRETIKLHKSESIYNLMNLSINKTISRTILTGGTTLMSCLVLLIFAGEVLRAFSFILTFGVIIGTYSSVFVASAIVLDYAEKTNHKIEF
jgi:preprotein translocase SecF subunit